MNEELALIEELRNTIPATQDMAHTMLAKNGTNRAHELPAP